MKETHLPLAPEHSIAEGPCTHSLVAELAETLQCCGWWNLAVLWLVKPCSAVVGETLQSAPEWTLSMWAPWSIQHVCGNLSSLNLSRRDTLLFTELIFVGPESHLCFSIASVSAWGSKSRFLCSQYLCLQICLLQLSWLLPKLKNSSLWLLFRSESQLQYWLRIPLTA